MTTATVEITSFGYLHGEEPEARLKVDLRHHFRDPHVRPELRYLTAHDRAVRDAVMATGGIRDLVAAAAAVVEAFLAGPRQDEPVTLAVGCAGGRHRAASVAIFVFWIVSGDVEAAKEAGVEELAARFAERDLDVRLVHRDLDKDVVDR
ncbi:RapZ C-terminal domain-containing protein [Streptomyces acidiscabies]|uniref:RNase adapter RapZ n=1 Tax=Streptomyces acidiscabies TaxID=42234 RepID=A0ABU4MD26_9ACTN|nr:RNase adapter RapZ [Streptomyces acidiscabies]MDX3025404.1 RNase adapter RapZ [Streptomyces acidiscabies]